MSTDFCRTCGRVMCICVPPDSQPYIMPRPPILIEVSEVASEVVDRIGRLPRRGDSINDATGKRIAAALERIADAMEKAGDEEAP